MCVTWDTSLLFNFAMQTYFWQYYMIGSCASNRQQNLCWHPRKAKQHGRLQTSTAKTNLIKDFESLILNTSSRILKRAYKWTLGLGVSFWSQDYYSCCCSYILPSMCLSQGHSFSMIWIPFIFQFIVPVLFQLIPALIIFQQPFSLAYTLTKIFSALFCPVRYSLL